MPNGLDPHEAALPEFAAARYAATRQRLIDDFHLTEDQAVEHLAASWRDQNEVDRQDWNRRLEEETAAQNAAEAERQRIQGERLRIEDEEKANAEKEERKKLRNKFVAFPDTPIPTTPLIIPSPLATRKLKKGEFCELYYFTNRGLRDAETHSHSMDDEALSLVQDEAGLHSFIPAAAARAKTSVVSDENLSWQQFDEAAHRMIEAMKENGWDKPRVDAHLEFWLALSSHAWKTHPDETNKRALLVYQARVRRRWHDSLGSTKAFNLRHLNAQLLMDIRNELVHEAMVAQIAQMKTASVPSIR